MGTSAAGANATYEYIDLWSRSTTWGGGPPPVEGDTVWIQPGQSTPNPIPNPNPNPNPNPKPNPNPNPNPNLNFNPNPNQVMLEKLRRMHGHAA